MDAVAVALSLLKETHAQPDLKLRARDYVERGRRVLFERHRAGGLEVAIAWATVMDHLIRHLYGVFSAEQDGRFPGQTSRLAVIAQGGYGRGELNPRSDIDLLFLHTWRVSPPAAAVAESLLHTLWDAGLQVGHATRSSSECLRLAESDMKVRTSLLDARFLCGDFDLYGEGWDFGEVGGGQRGGNFAGGGGASLGISLALGKCPDVAINHDPAAIAMHAANHPDTHHCTENVWKVSPHTVTRGQSVGLLWASQEHALPRWRALLAPTLAIVVAGGVLLPWYARNRIVLGPDAGLGTGGGLAFYFGHRPDG